MTRDLFCIICVVPSVPATGFLPLRLRLGSLSFLLRFGGELGFALRLAVLKIFWLGFLSRWSLLVGGCGSSLISYPVSRRASAFRVGVLFVGGHSIRVYMYL